MTLMPITFPLLPAAAVAAFFLSIVIIPLLIRLAHKKKWFDEVNHRKIHTEDIPRIGGAGIFLSFVLGIVVFTLLRHGFYPDLAIPRVWTMWPFIFGMLLIHGLGLIDDFKDIRPWLKVLVQLAAACIIAFFGSPLTVFNIAVFGVSVNLGPFAYVLAVGWIMGLSNAVNLLDGLDGLAGGTVAIGAVFLSIISVLQHNYLAAAASIVLFGSITGFLVFNFPPAKIFMGDSGSLFIGFFMASLPFTGEQLPSKATFIFIAALTVTAIPIIDTLSAILRRLKKRKPIHSPDKAHLHHKLLDLGVSTKVILAITYSATAILGVVCLGAVVFSHLVFKLFIPAAWVIVIVLFIILDRRYSRYLHNST